MLHQPQRLRATLLVGLFLVSIAAGLWIVRPFVTASLGRDAAAPVIHFERIAGGERLETYLPITPKPLITLINGGVYAIARDWRPVAWVEIMAYALCAVAGAALAMRVGSLASAAFVATAYLISPVLLRELAFLHAVPWALLAVLVAGLAVTGDRPRYWLAGIALMAGTLARLETILVVGLALAVLILLEIRARVSGGSRPPTAAYWVLLGFLAIPVAAVHDLLLTGDPLHWTKVAQINSEVAGTAQGPRWVIAYIGNHLLSIGPLVGLAVIGGLHLIQRRQWSLVVGLLAIIPGTAAFLIFMAARGVFFSPRYLSMIDLGLIFAAGISLAAIDVPATRRWLNRHVHDRLALGAVAVGIGVLAAIAFAPVGVVDPDVRQAITKQAKLLRNEHRAVEVILPELASTPRWWDPAADESADPKLLVPARVREQMAVDLDLALNQIVRTTEARIDPAAGRLVPGQIVYHDRLDDPEDPSYEALEIDRPTEVGGVRLVPLLADPERGIWVISVEAATGLGR
ncbi:MAG: hypothetical protein ABWY81_06790 [Jiangellaceae bacterium]